MELNSDEKLKKVLSKWELTYLSLGGIIGSGWLFAPLGAAAYAGVYSIFSWIISGFMMIIIALTYAEIASMLPRSGGIIRYPHYTHGKIVGFFMFWEYLISAVSTVSVEAVGAVTYLSHFLPSLYSNGQLSLKGILLTYLLIIIFFFANYYGVKILGRISHGMGWWKLIIPTITTIILFFFINSTNFTLPSNFEGMFYAIPASGIVFSYLGFRQAIEYGGEGKNPQKDIPFALLSSLSIAMVLFTLLQIGFIGALNISSANWKSLLSSPISNSPIFSVLQIHSIASIELPLDFWLTILIFDSIVSPIGTGIIYTGTSARTIYASATNGYLPKLFAKVNEKGIPEISLYVSIISAGLFLLPLPSWFAIVNISSTATVTTYIMGGIELESFRKLYPHIKRPFSLPYWRMISPLSTIFASLLVYWSGFSTLFYIIVIGLLGLSFYLLLSSEKKIINLISIINITVISILFYRFTNNLNNANNLFFFIFLVIVSLSIISQLILYKDKREVRASYWLIIFLVMIITLSYFSSFGLYTVIEFPYDTLILGVLMLIIHYLAVNTSIPIQT